MGIKTSLMMFQLLNRRLKVKRQKVQVSKDYIEYYEWVFISEITENFILSLIDLDFSDSLVESLSEEVGTKFCFLNLFDNGDSIPYIRGNYLKQ